MNISIAVIHDLYPLYEAGEVSADSRALIEEYLAEHPGALPSPSPALSLPAVQAPPDLEARALKRTTRVLEQRGLDGAAALTLSYVPVASGFFQQGKLHLLYQEHPLVSLFFYAAAVVMWVRFFVACRRVQVAGLRPPRSWSRRVLWILVGQMIGFAICAPIQVWTGWGNAMYFVPLIPFAVALWAGEWLDQIPKVDALTRPTTIFGPQDDDGWD